MSENGYQHASVHIPYFSKKHVSKIKSLKGIVYTFDESGKASLQKVEKKDFLHNEAEDNLSTIDFTFPNLKPGCVIEYSYTKIENDVLQLDSWDVQDDLPCLYAAHRIVIPDRTRLRYKCFGIDSVAHEVNPLGGNRETHVFYKENIPSFRSEPYMTSYRDNLLRVVFLLLPRNFFTDLVTAPDKMWKLAGLAYLDASFFRRQKDSLLPDTDSLVAAVKGNPSSSFRIRQIFDAVKNHSPGNVEQTMIPAGIAEAWKNKSGNAAELNLILLNLLRKVNVQCYPLLVSTRTHGQIDRDFPSIGQFNGMDVLAVDSERTYILDASIKSQSSKTPPANVLNRLALLLDKDSVRWVKLDDTRWLFRQDVSLFGCLEDDGTLRGEATITSHDYARMALLDSAAMAPEVAEYEAQKPIGLKIQQERFWKTGNDEDPVQQQMTFEYSVQKTGDFFFVKPQFLTTFNKNPFVGDTRNTDIDFGCKQRLCLDLTIDLPAALALEFLPKDVVLRMPDSSFFYHRICTRKGTAVCYKQVFEINSSLFYREDYAAVREFFKKLYGFFAEEIIFKKRK